MRDREARGWRCVSFCIVAGTGSTTRVLIATALPALSRWARSLRQSVVRSRASAPCLPSVGRQPRSGARAASYAQPLGAYVVECRARCRTLLGVLRGLVAQRKKYGRRPRGAATVAKRRPW